MSYYRVTESWSLWYPHAEELEPNLNPISEKGYSVDWTQEEWDSWHDYISKLIKQRRYILYRDEGGTNNYSQYIMYNDNGIKKNIYVIKMFKDLEGAQGYVDIIRSMADPVVMKIEFVEE
jgi:hypothetical protein